MEGGKVLKKKRSNGTRKMEVNINEKEKGLADQELWRRIKMLDLERRMLVSMERIARVRLFAARSEEVNSGKESEEEWLNIIRAEEDKTNSTN